MNHLDRCADPDVACDLGSSTTAIVIRPTRLGTPLTTLNSAPATRNVIHFPPPPLDMPLIPVLRLAALLPFLASAFAAPTTEPELANRATGVQINHNGNSGQVGFAFARAGRGREIYPSVVAKHKLLVLSRPTPSRSHNATLICCSPAVPDSSAATSPMAPW